jgi:CRISPR-associated endonuclease Csn1
MHIKAMGTRVFPIGCENFGSGKRELSKKAFKRSKRTTRFRYQRNRIRKIKVLELLIEHQMCPLTSEELYAWKEQKHFPKEELKDWFRKNPYQLRKKAVMEPLSLEELGRIIYQISIHRGFPISERNRGAKDTIMFNGLGDKNRPGINQTQTQIHNSSLGIYLNSLLPQENKSYTYTEERVRNRFLTREMFQNELENIWNFQAKFHPQLSAEIKKKLIGDSDSIPPKKGAVFFQRPLKSQKFRVGRCPFEPKKTKCCISSLIYQDLLAYRWANALKVNGKSLSKKDRTKAVTYFLTHRRFNFSRLKNQLEQPNAHYNIKDEESIKGSFVNATLSHHTLFGANWFDFDEQKRETIWHCLYFFDNEEKLKSQMIEKWGLNEAQATKFASLQLDKNYAPISKKASGNILYFLKRGINYDMAVILGGVKNCMQEKWNGIEETDIRHIINSVLKIYSENKVLGFLPQLTAFLKEEMELDQLQIKKLYGIKHSLEHEKTWAKFPVDKYTDKEIYNLKNPLLISAVFQLRKVLNELIETYGQIDEIRAELSADVKLNKYQRYLFRLDQRRRRNLRSKYITLLGERAENIIPLNLTKFELWEECKQTCPFTGSNITLSDLFTDMIQVVYINPWCNSLNDSHWNKTLCVRSFAEKIKDSSPYDYFNKHEPEQWGTVLKRAARLFSNTKDFPSSYRKFKRFIKKHNYRNPLKHQMRDSNVLSREVMTFLTRVVPEVSVAPGQATVHFIDKWRLHHLFDPEVYEEPNKDFRFKALLAYINANRNTDFLEILAQQNKYLPVNQRSSFPVPYNGFRDDLEYHIYSIRVSHKQERKLILTRKHTFKQGEKVYENFCLSVRGSLHKESVYGKRKSPEDQQEAFHLRKHLNLISTLKQVIKIVDPQVRAVVFEAIEQAGGFQGEKVPRNAFFSYDEAGFSVPKVFMPNLKGDPVPVKSVRIRESLTGVVQLKADLNQYVNLRNNHHVLIYLNKKQEYCEDVVSFWEVVRRARFKEPIYQLPKDGYQFITTLKINDVFLLDLEEKEIIIEEESNSFLAKHLYSIQKLSSKFYEFRLVHDNNLTDTGSPNYVRINNFGHHKTCWHTHNPIKVKVNSIGELSFENEQEKFIKMQKSYV